MITVFGATGFTGRRVAQALEARQLPFRLAGRSRDRLAALAAQLATRPEIVLAEAHAPEALPAPAGPHLLINCAGPFTDLGEPVVRLAALRGWHYLDLSNELGFVYSLGQYAALARQTGAAVVPACAFEVALADCLIRQQAAEWPGPLDAVDVVYAWPARTMSYGTRLSGLRAYAAGWVAYQEGRWRRQAPAARVFCGQLGGLPFQAITFPSAEVVTVPAHTPARSVAAWLAVSARWARAVATVLPLVSGLLRTPVGRLVAFSFRHLAPPPQPTGQDRFAIQVQLRRAAETRRWTLRGVDPYGLSAQIVAYAAEALLTSGARPGGVFAPASVLDPERFLTWAQAQGVTLQPD